MKYFYIFFFSCLIFALSEAVIAQTPTRISENFDAGITIPSGWSTVQVVGTGGAWAFNTPANIGRMGSGTWLGGAFSSPNIAAFKSYNAANGDETRLITPVLDFTSVSSPVFTFQFSDVFNTAADYIVVEGSSDGGTTWTNLQTFATRGAGATNNWLAKSVDISAYATLANVRFAFRAHCNYGYNFGIDDVLIGQLPAQDVGVTAVSAPAATGYKTANTITATIKNYGTASQGSGAFNVIVKIWQTSGGSESSPEFTATEACTTAIGPGSTGIYSFSSQWTPASYVAYTVKVYTVLAGDETAGNDAYSKTVTIIPQTDLQLNSIVYPAVSNLYVETLGYSITCTVKNNGTGAVAGNTYQVEAWIGLTSGFPGNASYYSTISTPTINAGATSSNINLSGTWVPAVPGNYTIRYKVTLAGDEISSNDTKEETRVANSYNYGGGNAGNGGYYFANSTSLASGAPSQPVYSWIDPLTLPGSTEITSWTSGNADDGYYNAALPFSFTFFGNPYTNLYICSNGFVSFGAGSTSRFYAAIPNSAAPNNFIAGAWLDNNLNNTTYPDAHVYFGGDASRFVITYWHAHKYGSATDWITYQVILTPDGNIKIQYNDLETPATPPTSIVNSCTVGIENSAGTAGIQYRYNGTGGAMFGSPVAVQFGLNNTLLPVELTSFTAASLENSILLKWTTATEIQNTGFEIERTQKKTNNTSGTWNKIGFIKGSGNSNSPKEYSFTDKKVIYGIYEYRLKQINQDGSFEYSKIVNTNFGKTPTDFSISNYPNPFNPATVIKFALPKETKVNLSVYNVLGERVAILLDEFLKEGIYERSFDGKNFTSGIYIYVLQTADGITLTKKMILLK